MFSEKTADALFKVGVGSVAALFFACWVYSQTANSTTPAPSTNTTQSNYDSCLEVNKQLAAAGVGGNDCERVKNWRSARQRLADAGGRTQLIRDCEATFKPLLKDPDSYRYLDADVVSTGDSGSPGGRGLNVTVRYTATNSFGGRVQQSHTCAA